MLFLFISIEQAAICLDIVGNQLCLADRLEHQGLDCMREEIPRALEDRVGIALEVDELRVGEHLEQRPDTPRVRRVFAQVLRPTGVGERYFYQLEEGILELLSLCLGNLLERQEAVAIFHHPRGEEPEIIVGRRHHIGKRKLLLLRQIHLQLHVVGRPVVRHQERHILLEKRLPPKHKVGEDGLVRRRVAKVLVARKNIVDKRRTAPPVPEDKQRVHFQRLVGYLLIARVLERD